MEMHEVSLRLEVLQAFDSRPFENLLTDMHSHQIDHL